MSRFRLLGALALAALTVAGCAANPIVARDPVPAPTGGESFSCDATPVMMNGFWADCERRGRHYEHNVVHAKG